MNAAILYGPEDVRVERVQMPPVGPREVRIRIRAALTCGTDVKVYRRGYHARMLTPPCRYGHEMAGEIEAIGEGVVDWKPGDRVVAANSAPCGECFFCRRDQPGLCEDLLFINGAFAQFITIPERIVRSNLLRIPDALSFENAAMVEPLACVLHGLEETPVRADDTVAVIGPGPIGLMFVKMCSALGAWVICVGRGADRLAAAEALGAARTISARDSSDVVKDARAAANGGRGPDVVFECVGSPDTWAEAVALVRKGGIVNLFGGCPSGTGVELDTDRLHYDAVELKGTFHHTPRTIRRALELLGGGLDLDPLLSDSAPLSALPKVLEDLSAESRKIKVVIHPN